MLLSNHGFVFPFMLISFIGAISAISSIVSCRIFEKWLFDELAHENNK